MLTKFLLLIVGRVAKAKQLPASESITLPQAFVPAITQDQHGIIWMATLNGLYRYDGMHVKIFQPSADGRPSCRLLA
ncbi:hypothetical protein [Spirosoma harenae]